VRGCGSQRLIKGCTMVCPPLSVKGLSNWSGKTGSLNGPTRFCVRLPHILHRRSSTADKSDRVLYRRPQGRIGVESVCKQLPIAPSTFHEHKARETDENRLPPREKRDREFSIDIQRVWKENFCFLERFYQFRHQEGKAVAGKLGIAVGVGGSSGDPVVLNIKTFFQYNQIECIGTVSAQGPACCFVCGYGETCKVGAIHMFFGPGTKITPEITPSLSKQSATIEEARSLGRMLEQRLRGFASAT